MISNIPTALVKVPKDKVPAKREALKHLIGESVFGVSFNPARDIISYSLHSETSEAKIYQVVRL